MTDTTEEASATAAPDAKTATVEQKSTDAPAAAESVADPAEDTTGTTATPEETGDDPTDEGQPKKKGGGFQNRIDKLTREKYQAEFEAEKAKKELEEERRKTSSSAVDVGEEPKLDSGKYKDVEEWQKDYAKWVDAKKDKEIRQRLSQETVEQAQQQKALEVKSSIAAREAATRQKYPDYDAVVMPLGPILMGHSSISEYVAHEDMGTEMAYHLANNPAILDEIRRLPTFQATRELLKLEAKLKAAPPPKPITKAPDPIKPVGGSETIKRTLVDLAAKDDASDYIKRRNQQRAKAG